jgi:hypothetical protein
MANDKKGINPLATGVAGAIIGAAAAAAAVALSDEKNRKKAEKILDDMQKEGNKIFKEVSRLAMDLKDRAEKALPEPKVEKKASKKASTKKKK